jgi:hypothetical protein
MNTPETVTAEQWARAEALKALLAADSKPLVLRAVAVEVNLLAGLILTGQLPPPAPGTYY